MVTAMAKMARQARETSKRKRKGEWKTMEDPDDLDYAAGYL